MKDIAFIHYARIWACLAVILIHTVSTIVAQLRVVPLHEWWVANIIDSAIVSAVPLFVMLSGALLLKGTGVRGQGLGGIRGFYRRRFWKVGLPTLFWVLVYFVFYQIYLGEPLNVLSMLKWIIFGQPYPNLYFLFIILELYVLTPFIREIVGRLSSKEYLYLVALFFFIGIFWKYQRFVGTMFVPYLGFYLAGGYLIKYSWIPAFAGMTKGAGKKILLGTYTFTVVVIAVMTYLSASHTIYNFNDDFLYYHHTNPLVIIQTVVVFLFFQHFVNRFPKRDHLKRWLLILSGATLGMYVIHWPLRLLVFNMISGTKDEIIPLPLAYVPIVYMVLVLASLGITLLLKQIPGLKRMV